MCIYIRHTYPEDDAPSFRSTEQSFIVVLKNTNYVVDSAPNGGDSIGENGKSIGENAALNKTQIRIIEAMRHNPKVSAKTIAEEIGIALRNVEEYIHTLKKLGMIERIGSAKGGHWVVKRNDEIRLQDTATPD